MKKNKEEIKKKENIYKYVYMYICMYRFEALLEASLERLNARNPEMTQGQILSQLPTDATRFWWHLYGS